MASESANFKIEQRAYVKIRTLLQVSSTDIHKDLIEVYNDRTLPYSTIVNWTRRFREGRESIEDKSRAGFPAPVTNLSSRFPNYLRKTLIFHCWR